MSVSVELTDEGVGVVTIHGVGPKNALDPHTIHELSDLLPDLDADPEYRVLVLAGANGNFCAGADLGSGLGHSDPLVAMQRLHQLPLALHRLRTVTIAKVDGVAVGAGMNLALGCDLVVATDRARFAEIFVRRGLVVDFGGSWLLPRLIGLQRAKELCLSGDLHTAADLAGLGLINHVVEPDRLDETVATLAGRMAAGPALAQAAIKQLLNESADLTFAQALDHESQAQADQIGTAEFREAMRAFRDKRDPDFRGGPGS